MKPAHLLTCLLVFLFSCSPSFHYSDRRFKKSFYVSSKNEVRSSQVVKEVKEKNTENDVELEPVSMHTDSALDHHTTTTTTTTNLALHTSHSDLHSPHDTIPTPDPDKKVKLNRAEKVSFALITVGTVFIMIAIGLLVFVLVGLLSGGAIASSVWYFIGGTALVGYLLREWGIQRKS